MPTYTPKASEIERAWHVVDADGLVLGRMATEVARVLRGKHKTMFAPHLDTGDHVVIVNASKVVLSASLPGGGANGIRAAHVLTPTRPSTARPWASWKRRTSASVPGPKYPSTSTRWPAAASACWMARTAGPSSHSRIG